MSIAPGSQIGPFVILRELGSGGMGTVYLAEHRPPESFIPGFPGTPPASAEATPFPDGRVALKVLHPRLLEREGAVARFRREAELGVRVEHPNVVRTYAHDSARIDGVDHLYLVMQYVEGQTLRSLRRELESVPEDLCRHVGLEVAQGLAAIHAAGAVHRDLKPENVLITREHQVTIMDLGIAHLAEETLRISMDGAFVGSVQFAAPEQFAGDPIDARTDLHALGVMLYTLSCGTLPYPGRDFKAVMRRVCHEAPHRLGELNPQLSPFFEELVHVLLEKEPDRRIQSATELIGLLRAGEDSGWWHERVRMIRARTRRPPRRVRVPRETAVHGREAELAKLRQLFTRAQAGDGQLVLVEGEAGIGKSRLVDELVQRLLADGEEFDFLWGSHPPGGAATSAGAIADALAEHLGEEGSRPYLEDTPLLVEPFDALLRGEPAPLDQPRLSREALQTCLVHVTRGLAAARPLILLIDDLHFAPQEAHAMFASMAHGLPGHRILLLGTSRPGLSDEWVAGLSRLEQTTRLELQRLGPRDLAVLLAESLASETLADHLGRLIAIKSDGNPFFVFEILRGLREGNFITQREDGSWTSVQTIEELQVPSSVMDLVNARVSDLTEAERDLLDVACCLGFEFDPSLVGDVLGMPRVPLLKQFGQIERKHRLVRASGRRYQFDHHQVQEALYRSLHEQIREEYHASLARALEVRVQAADTDPADLPGAAAVDLCRHYLRGGCGAEALRYVDAAMRHLLASSRRTEAVDVLEQLLALPGVVDGVRRAEFLSQLSSQVHGLGRIEESIELARQAETLAAEEGDSALAHQTAVTRGARLAELGRTEEAEVLLEEIIRQTRATGDGANEASAHGELGRVFIIRSEFARARKHFEENLEIARRLQSPQHEGNALQQLGIVANKEGRYEEARAFYLAHLAIEDDQVSPDSRASSMANLGIVALDQGNFAEAEERLESALAVFRQRGNRVNECRATGSLGNVFHAQGMHSRAIALLERQLVLGRETGNPVTVASAEVSLGGALLALGQLERAQQMNEQALAHSRAAGARWFEGYALHYLADVHAELGEEPRAMQLLEECLALRREIGHHTGAASTLHNLAELRLLAGDAEGAATGLEEAEEIARSRGHHSLRAEIAALRANLPGADVADALRELTEGLERGLEERTSVRYLLWQATGDPAHLQVAKDTLDAELAKNPEHHHEAMCSRLRINRSILADWAAQQGDLDQTATLPG